MTSSGETSKVIGDCDVVFKLDPNVEQEPIIEIKMRCNGCGVRIAFDVTSRRANQDIKEWIESVQMNAGVAHQYASPLCDCRTADLQIPMPEGTKSIGEVPKS
jgi:hypothetical protein